jgi:hypothetical protein
LARRVPFFSNLLEDQVEEIVAESMEKALNRIIPEVPFAAEIRVVEAWECAPGMLSLQLDLARFTPTDSDLIDHVAG